MVAVPLAVFVTESAAQQAGALAVIAAGIVPALGFDYFVSVEKRLPQTGEQPWWLTIASGVLPLTIAWVIQDLGPVRGEIGTLAAGIAAGWVLWFPVQLIVERLLRQRKERADRG